jgi:hypothetical protein
MPFSTFRIAPFEAPQLDKRTGSFLPFFEQTSEANWNRQSPRLSTTALFFDNRQKKHPTTPFTVEKSASMKDGKWKALRGEKQNRFRDSKAEFC